jgi:hypothetical protein
MSPVIPSALATSMSSRSSRAKFSPVAVGRTRVRRRSAGAEWQATNARVSSLSIIRLSPLWVKPLPRANSDIVADPPLAAATRTKISASDILTP